MTAYDPALCDRLVAQAATIASRLEQGFGVKAVTSNFLPTIRDMADQLEAARRHIDQMCEDAEVGFARMHAIDCENREQRDADDRKLIGDYEARLEAVAAERDALRAEVERMQSASKSDAESYCRALDRAHEREMQLSASDVQARQELADARERILQLEETARAASENWMAACRQRDEARAALSEACAGLGVDGPGSLRYRLEIATRLRALATNQE